MQRLHHSLLQWRHTSPLKLFALAAAFIFVSASLVFYSRPASPSDVDLIPSLPSSNNNTESTNTCYVDLDILRSHGYNSSAKYARLEIAVTRTENFTGFSDTLHTRFPAYQKIRLDTVEHRELLSPKICSPAVTIQAPLPVAPPNASHLLFGVATTLERLEDSLDAFAHWAGRTDARVYALVESEILSEIKRVQQRANELDIRLTIIQSDDERLDRYFSLLRVLLKHRDASSQWAVLIDDDTFFPSMRNLVNRLATYDATKPQYIGALTEDLAQMFSWSYMAYGGAGIFLSMPLLEQLDRVFDDCNDIKTTGDRRVAMCIYAHTSTKLTWDRDLYQLDLRGDASGFYESGRPLPLSVHHWKSWFQADMVGLGQVAAICGDSCLLHRWRLTDNWFLVNGFSMIKYTSLEDVDLMEKTWEDSKYRGGDGFAFSLGPFRRKDEEKVSFRLQSATQQAGSVRQIYIHDLGPKKPPEVLEVVWKPASTG
ncbi:glycosyltransferase family 31 protein [Aspergillus thermomutatus]|uniref:Glycosyltransferase family 31 protein n=1 Tax=Aspergillus thermomutatus TaxID=41047 RepID=A0A397GDH7_ASPTH|nr:uncharacterized protein CDV56_101413 [Aspergillus thermomutatus]RHZ46140.1 hypothetical protein CDV56_101413 [Aspergillus thermomutatus]